MRLAGLLWLVSLVLAVSLGPSGQCTPATREAHETAGDRRATLFVTAAVLSLVATAFVVAEATRRERSQPRGRAGVAILLSLGGTAALVLAAILSVTWVCVEL